MLVRSSNGQSDRPLNGRVAVQIRAGQPYAGMCASRLMAGHLTFNQDRVGSIPTWRTSRVYKRGLVAQLVEQGALNAEDRVSTTREPTNGSVVQMEDRRSPKAKTRVRVLADPPISLERACSSGAERLVANEKVVSPILTTRSNAPVVQVAEYVFGKDGVAGSTPARSSNAGVAQLAEQLPCKQKAGGSKPSTSSSWCSTTAVQLIRNQQVVGSIPSASSKSMWGCSSDGRTPALQAGGREFNSLHLHHTRGPVAQPEERRAEDAEEEVQVLSGPPCSPVAQLAERVAVNH